MDTTQTFSANKKRTIIAPNITDAQISMSAGTQTMLCPNKIVVLAQLTRVTLQFHLHVVDAT